MFSTDSDGDLILDRKQKKSEIDTQDAVLSEMHLDTKHRDDKDYCTTYEMSANSLPPLKLWHSLSTPLGDVGLQVWRGAALLADYILHDADLFRDKIIAELGAGPGLASLAAARTNANCVFATDINRSGILENCHRNIEANNTQDVVKPRHLDWMHPPEWLVEHIGVLQQQERSGTSAGLEKKNKLNLDSKFNWMEEDTNFLLNLDYVIAADTIYDDELTEYFMKTALALLTLPQQQHQCRMPRLLVALERRECFTLLDLDVRAPAYDFWRQTFLFNSETKATDALISLGEWALAGEPLEVSRVPQLLQGYQRSKELELWELHPIKLVNINK